MTARLIIADVFEGIDALRSEGTKVDLILTSPPFLALRSYLPSDHPDKHKEIGSEPDPAEFLDTMLRLVAALDLVLAPHGSIVFELGDTYAGSGGGGGDYSADGLRAGQPVFDGSGRRVRETRREGFILNGTEPPARRDLSQGWPLDKSLCFIPELFGASLAYGRNLLTGEPSPAGQWRVRNKVPWARPNPPVGALGDKWRPATSYVTVACRARDRWFDLDAVRTGEANEKHAIGFRDGHDAARADVGLSSGRGWTGVNPAGAPPLDWFVWDDPESEWSPDDGMWVIPTAPYAGAHYACWPPKLAHRIIDCMCPREVCRVCGTPRRRIVSEPEYVGRGGDGEANRHFDSERAVDGANVWHSTGDRTATRVTTTLGWTDCGHADYRPGLVLDPFAGSGTTLAVASGLGRDSIGIDLDSRNADLAMERVGPLLLTVEGAA